MAAVHLALHSRRVGGLTAAVTDKAGLISRKKHASTTNTIEMKFMMRPKRPFRKPKRTPCFATEAVFIAVVGLALASYVSTQIKIIDAY